MNVLDDNQDSDGDHKSNRSDREQYDRDRDSDSHKDGQYRRRSRSNSRWEKKSEERNTRDEDRYYRDDSSDSVDNEPSCNGAVIGASGSEIVGYKGQPPNNTIVILGLAKHITESNIYQDIIQCGLKPTNLQLIRKKDTGASRGFAFVEFCTLAEATQWMDMKKGVLILQHQYRASMQYSVPKQHKVSCNWFCGKCGTQNFTRQNYCFKCSASHMESEEGGIGSDETCSYTTKTIMLRNLDVLTTEDSVMQVLTSVIPEVAKQVYGICIGRDALISVSRGICYLGTDSILDSQILYRTLTNLSPPLSIDGKTVTISYCKYNMGNIKTDQEQAINSVFPNAGQSNIYSLNEIHSLAQYSGYHFAKTVVEYQRHFEYYKNLFTQQITAGNSITLHQDNQMNAVNAAATVAESAIQQVHANKMFYDATHLVIPNGTDGKRYPIPDITKFIYERSSGYHYDSSTHLYYDSVSTYYWNSVIQKYLYYDHEKLTYLLAPVFYGYAGVQQPAEIGAEPESKKRKAEKPDKVKAAKKIAKDMERWTKRLNEMKENTESSSSSLGSASSPDVRYSMLEKNDANLPLINCTPNFNTDSPPHGFVHSAALAVCGKSESFEEESTVEGLEFLDFIKTMCTLCKQQFTSGADLAKHGKLSDLHRKNLKMHKANSKKNGSSVKVVHRDRAKERRMVYGYADEPQPNKLKERYLKCRELADKIIAASIAKPNGPGNVGNCLLQKVGWTKEQALGNAN